MKLFVEIYKRLYRYFMAIHIRLWVGTLYLLLKGDLGIARKGVSTHFIVVNLYILWWGRAAAKQRKTADR